VGAHMHSECVWEGVHTKIVRVHLRACSYVYLHSYGMCVRAHQRVCLCQHVSVPEHSY
jgi:hypothetical protein